MAFHEYPYTDFHEMNLDWVIKKVKELATAWAQVQQDWTDEQAAFANLKSWIENYFNNLNVQTEINVKLDAMVEAGTMSELIAPFVASGLPAVVADQIGAVVASQIGPVVAAQIGAVVADQLPAVAAAAAAAEVSAWLAAHVNPETGYVIDDSLTVHGAAADAKATGDKVTAINSALSDFEGDTFVYHHSENRIIVSELQKNKGINSDGSIVDSEGKSVTGIIKVEGEYAYFGYDGVAHSPQRVSLFDATQTFIERVNITTPYHIDTSTVFYIQAAVNTTSDNVYIGFFDSNEATPNYNSEYFADYYTLKTECLPVGIFDGLKCVAFGTSLTARAEEDHKYDYTTHGYLTYLRQYSGMTIDNQGLGGAKILSDTANKSIYLAITGYTGYSDKNVCIIEGFVNDWDKNNANALGTYTDTTLNSVCGRLRSAINFVLGQNANMTVIVILDHYGRDYGGEEFSSTTVKNGYTQFQYYDELAKVCESLGVKCIKEYAISEICQLTPQYLEDYIHCNDLGARQSATTIWNVMKGFSPNLVSA